MGLENAHEKPSEYGFFVAVSTSMPSWLSIPCFYYAGLKYVDHKKREESIIEAAEVYSIEKGENKVKLGIKRMRHDSRVGGLKPVSSSMKLTSSQMR